MKKEIWICTETLFYTGTFIPCFDKGEVYTNIFPKNEWLTFIDECGEECKIMDERINNFELK